MKKPLESLREEMRKRIGILSGCSMNARKYP